LGLPFLVLITFLKLVGASKHDGEIGKFLYRRINIIKEWLVNYYIKSERKKITDKTNEYQ